MSIKTITNHGAVFCAATTLIAASALPAAASGTTGSGQSFTIQQLSGDLVHAGPELDLPAVDPTTRIVGGELAPADAYPWIAKVLIKTAQGTYGCGGSFISNDIVLTAQHCVKGNPDSVSIKYGNHTWRDGKDAAVASIARGEGIKKGDWAVLKLTEPIPGVPTIPLAKTTKYNNGPQFQAMGWGALKQHGATAADLMHVTLPVVTDADCGTGPEEICAGDLAEGGIDTCQGDSGGPLVSTTSGTAVQVGIVSWGVGCAKAGNPGHYTEVSTYLDSINAAITSLGGQPASVIGDDTQPTPTPTTPQPTATPEPTTPEPTTTAEPTATPEPTNTPDQPGPTNPVTPTSPVEQKPVSLTNDTSRYIYNYGTTTSRIRSNHAGAQKVKIKINMTHRCSEHVRIILTTPDGKRNLLKRASYAQGQQCSAWFGEKSATYTLQSSSRGLWTIQFTDMYSGHPGKLNSWGIDLSS